MPLTTIRYERQKRKKERKKEIPYIREKLTTSLAPVGCNITHWPRSAAAHGAEFLDSVASILVEGPLQTTVSCTVLNISHLSVVRITYQPYIVVRAQLFQPPGEVPPPRERIYAAATPCSLEHHVMTDINIMYMHLQTINVRQ